MEQDKNSDFVVFNTFGPMICASAEAEEKTYKVFKGKSGRRWLVAIQPNEGDNVYAESLDPNSDGFAGRTLTFKMEDGTELKLQGPWHSNADSLFTDTGYDCRDKHAIRGVISTGRENTEQPYVYKYTGILHYDKEIVIGTFDRIDQLAQEYADKLNTMVYFAYKSNGCGCSGSREPKKKE